MEDINDILLGYAEAMLNLNRVIKEKGDWSKLEILLANDEVAKESLDTINIREAEFIEATSLGRIYTYQKEFDRLFRLMQERTTAPAVDGSVAFHLEEARDMFEDLLRDGSEDRRVKAIDMLAQLPNFDPDDWIRRKYMMKGFYVEGIETEIPLYLARCIEEASCSFIYGNFHACIALARTTVEVALKTKFPILAESSLNDIANKLWFMTKGLKEHPDVQKLVDCVRRTGNQIVHGRENKVAQMCNELIAKTILGHLKAIIEFLYTV